MFSMIIEWPMSFPVLEMTESRMGVCRLPGSWGDPEPSTFFGERTNDRIAPPGIVCSHNQELPLANEKS